jgi:hypothetical protein
MKITSIPIEIGHALSQGARIAFNRHCWGFILGTSLIIYLIDSRLIRNYTAKAAPHNFLQSLAIFFLSFIPLLILLALFLLMIRTILTILDHKIITTRDCFSLPKDWSVLWKHNIAGKALLISIGKLFLGFILLWSGYNAGYNVCENFFATSICLGFFGIVAIAIPKWLCDFGFWMTIDNYSLSLREIIKKSLTCAWRNKALLLCFYGFMSFLQFGIVLLIKQLYDYDIVQNFGFDLSLLPAVLLIAIEVGAQGYLYRTLCAPEIVPSEVEQNIPFMRPPIF